MLAQTPAGARLIMLDGTIEQSGAGRRRSFRCCKFQRYVFDLDQFAGPARATERATSERYLGELFWPRSERQPQQLRNAYFAEGA